MQQAELDDHDLDRQEHGDRGSERGTGRRPEHVGIGQRVAEQALEGRAGDRESRSR